MNEKTIVHGNPKKENWIERTISKPELNDGSFKTYIQGEFKTTELDKYLYELAKEYNDVCEAYDMTICTGHMGRDGIMPANGREMGMISRHAIRFFKKLVLRAKYERGISSELVRSAIKNYRIRSS